MQPTDDFMATEGTVVDSDTRTHDNATLGPRPPRRWRAVEGGAAVVALLVVFVVLVQPTWLHLPTLQTPFAPATPTPAPVLTHDTIMLDSDIVQANLTINGQTQKIGPWQQVRLSAGFNHLRVDAPPFPPIECDIIWPLLRDGTCPITTQVLVNTPTGGRAYVPVVRLTHTIGALPADQQRAINAAITDLFSSIPAILVTTMAPGMHYGSNQFAPTGLPEALTAAQPTRMAMRLIRTEEPLEGCLPSPCGATFDDRNLINTFPPSFWLVSVPVDLLWDYQSAQGEQRLYLYNSHTTRLTFGLYFSQGAWAVAYFSPFPKGLDVFSQITQGFCEAGRLAVEGFLPAVTASPATGTVEGCAFTVQSRRDATKLNGRFIERFGVLLTADAAAQHLLPDLPMATPAELALFP
jgi:hypothetical protein